MPRASSDHPAGVAVEDNDWRQALRTGAVLLVLTLAYFLLVVRIPRYAAYAVPGAVIATLVGGWANKAASEELPRWAVPAIVLSLWLPLTLPLFVATLIERR